MKIGILGTGMVGETIASALIKKEHSVMLGSRTADNEKAAKWVEKNGKNAAQGTFNDAAAFGELLFICLNGEHALEVVSRLDANIVEDKIIIDCTNPLDFSQGMPPRMLDGLSNTTSLGEEIQKTLPDAIVVKVLNTVNCELMVDARKVNNGDHHLFLCGDRADAKNQVMHFLADNFYWKADRFVDLGGIEAARCMEAFVPLWACVFRALGTPLFSFKLVK